MRTNARTSVLIDVTHPAHVLRYLPIAEDLVKNDYEVVFAGRDKEVTIELLQASGLPFRIVRAGRMVKRDRSALFGLAAEFTGRVVGLAKLISSAQPRYVLTSNPTGVWAGRLRRRVVIFDTTDGSDVGIHHSLAAPLASVITSPVSVGEDFGPRHIAYRSFKALSWLHPDRRAKLDGEDAKQIDAIRRPIVLLRIVAHTASHDADIQGLTLAEIEQIQAAVATSGATLIVSAETDHLGVETADILKKRPELLQFIISAASLVIGDSASVIEEAALLGVPALRISTKAGERRYLQELETRYGLVQNFRTEDSEEFIEAVRCVLSNLDLAGRNAAAARDRLLADHHDGVGWYVSLIAAIDKQIEYAGALSRHDVSRLGLDER